MGIQFQTPRIVQPGGKNWIWLIILVIVVVILTAWQAYKYGQKSAGFNVEKRDFQQVAMQARIEKLEEERDALRLQAAKFERASQIDRSAAIDVQADVKKLQNERADLKRELEFLKSLVSGDITMLQVQDLKLVKNEKGNSYQYSFTVSKRAKGRNKVKGSLTLAVSGQLKGEAHQLKMTELGIKAKRFAMGFSFYQKFEGELTLPVGFIPKNFHVMVKPSSKKFKPFDETLAWKAK